MRVVTQQINKLSMTSAYVVSSLHPEYIFWGLGWSTLWFCLMDLNLDLCSIDVIIIKITKMLQDEYFNISVLTKDLCE